MHTEKLVRTLLVLLIIIAGIYLVGRLWSFLASVSELLLIFGVGWLVAYVLAPAVEWLGQLHAPGWARRRLARIFGRRTANLICQFRIGRTAAIGLTYLALLAGIVLSALYLVPALVSQLTQFSAHIPQIINDIPKYLADADAWLAARNINISLVTIYDQLVVQQRAEALLGQLVQYAITAARAVLTIVGTSVIILAVSLYMMLDSRQLRTVFWSLVPSKYHDELSYASQTIDRIFGGFVRAQVLMAALGGVFTLIVTLLAGLQSALIVSWISGLIMLVPLVGAPVAMILPAVVALFQQPDAALWLFIVMTVFQQIELHFIIPRIMSETMGLPTTLVIAATILGLAFLGFWGLIFGVPIVAVLYALGVYFLQRVKRDIDQESHAVPEPQPSESADVSAS